MSAAGTGAGGGAGSGPIAGVVPSSAAGGVAGAGRWELPLMLVAGAVVALPDVFSMDALKTGALGLLAAAVLVPRLLLAARADAAGFLASGGALLYLAAALWAVPGALGALWHASVADRMLDVLLALAAGALGAAARRAAPGALQRGLVWATLVTAVAALWQAIGLDRLFTPGPEEVVALMGNSTRAGVALALGLPAALAALVAPDRGEAPWRARLASGALLMGVAALVLTRARGGWIAGAGGLLATAWCLRGASVVRVRTWAVPLLGGVALALVLSPTPGALLRSKLDEVAPVLSAADTTAHVRLAVWRGTLAMASERPFGGWGLGRYRERFPPFREPAEAELPGLAGARTEVDHPHNELLLAFAEGGLPSGLLLLAFLGATLARAARRARGGTAGGADAGTEAGTVAAAGAEPTARAAPLSGDRAALGILAAGTLAALVQDAWTMPGTALPFFAAAGWVWAPDSPRPPSAPVRAVLVGGGLAAMVVLAVLALPRLRVQWELRRFLHRAQAADVSRETLPLLVRAADADPGDVDAQRLLAFYGGLVLGPGPPDGPPADAQADAPGDAPGDALAAGVARARARLAELAPHDAAADVPR
jgi:O-antigen ligase